MTWPALDGRGEVHLQTLIMMAIETFTSPTVTSAVSLPATTVLGSGVMTSTLVTLTQVPHCMHSIPQFLEKEVGK